MQSLKSISNLGNWKETPGPFCLFSYKITVTWSIPGSALVFLKGLSLSIWTALLPPVLSLQRETEGSLPPSFPFPSIRILSDLWGLGSGVRQWEAPLPLAFLKAGWSPDFSLCPGLISVPWLLGVGGHQCRNGITSPCIISPSPLHQPFPPWPAYWM